MDALLSLGSSEGVPVLMRATILLAAAVLLAVGLRRGSAGTRHLLWTTTFATLLCLPLAVIVLPSWEIPVLPPAAERGVLKPAGTDGVGEIVAPALVSPPVLESPESSQFGGQVASGGEHRETAFPPRSLLAAIWVLGTLAALGSIAVGAFRLRHLVRRALPVDDPDWLGRLGRLQRRLGVDRGVRLLVSPAALTPMTAGWRHHVVLLPAAALDWPAALREVVLAHELIHVRRRDAARQLLAHVALSLYWFHPLSWLASRLAAGSREQACDEAVVALGTRPSEYATHLLDLATSMGPTPAVVTLPMVQRSHLERRVMAILEPHRPRTRPAVAAVALLLLGIVGVSVAVARPVPAQSAATAKPATSVAPQPVRAPAIVVPATGSTAAQERTCRVRGLSGSFSGTLSNNVDSDGETRYEHSGWHNGDRIIQRHLDGLRLCMRLHGEVVMADDGRSVRAVGRDSWVVLESEGSDSVKRLEITEGPGGIEHAWSIGGRSQTFGQDAQEWREQMFAVLGGLREASNLRGQQSSLRGRISSYRGHVSSLKGRISSHRGHVSSLKGQMSSYRGHVSSLKGQMSSYRGQVSSLKGQMSSYRARISRLMSAVDATSDSGTQAGLEREIVQQEQRIQKLEQQIAEYDLEGRVAGVESQISAYDLEQRLSEVQTQIAQFDFEAKIREVEAEIEAFDLDAKIREIEAQIEELDAERRAEEIERRIEPEIEALKRLSERL